MPSDQTTPAQDAATDGPTLHIALTHPERWATALVLTLAIAFHLIALYPEVSVAAPPLNDNVLHLLNVRHAADAFAQGQNPTDPWLGQVTLGYPLFHHYQHLAYLLPGLIVALSKGALSAQSVLNWTNYLLLSLFPLSIYWSGRRWGLDRLPALCASVLGSLLATDGLYGLDASSYAWSGYGLYTQLWGMWLLPLGLAQGYYLLRTGRGVLLAVVLVAATLLSHLVFGYMLLVSLALLALVGPWRLSRRGQDASPGRRIGRLIALGLLVALVAAYFLAPYFADRAAVNRSVWELPWKYNSFGAKWVLTALVKGELFDAGRFPSLTLLFVAGLGFCFWRWREERLRALAALTLLWLLLYFGRPTWGALLDLLPMNRDLHLHRLIAGVHLGGIYLIGLGLAWVWNLARSQRNRRWLLAPAALTLLLLAPVCQERIAYYRQNGARMAETASAVAAESASLDELTQAIRALPPGRVYAGLAARWGKDLRVGAVPLYALLNEADLDMLGYLYHALSLNADIQVHFNDGRLAQYNLFNVRYVVLPQDWSVPSFYRVLGDYGRWRLYGVETSGYFDLVDADITLAGPKDKWYNAASAWLASNLVAAKQHPVVALGPELSQYGRIYPFRDIDQVIAGVAADPGPSRGTIRAETVENGVYETDVRADRASYLMLKVGYHPRWRATVDGARAEIVMLMPSYIGVQLAPGEHHVRLAYEPGIGRWLLMGLGLLTLLVIGRIERWPGSTQRLLGRLRQWAGRIGARRPSATRLQRAVHVAGAAFGDAHLPYLGGVLLLTLLAGLPLLQMKMMNGHDAPEYITRAVEFYEGLKAGQVFPRWAPDLNFGYGEPFFSFNPPLIYYLMALFRALGASFVAAQDLACLLLLSASSLGMYLLAAELFGKRGGVIAAAAYLFAPYMLTALYVRQALADYSAFASLPLVFWGLYRYARDGRYLFLLAGAAGMALLMLSSNPVALIATPVLIGWVAWLGWREHRWRVFARGFGGIVLGMALSAFFWLPALTERHLVQTTRLFEGYLSYRNHFVYLSQFLASPWGYGLSLAGPTDGMSFVLGAVHLIAAACALLLLWLVPKSRAHLRPWLVFFLALLTFSVFFSSTLSQAIWDRLPLLQYLEFPWRFLSLAAFSSALLCGSAVVAMFGDQAKREKWLARAVAVLALAGLLAWGLPKARPDGFMAIDETRYTPQAIAALGTGVTTAGEYAPIWVQERPSAPAGAPLVFVNGQGRLLGGKDASDRRVYVVEATEASRLRVDTSYYPGWTLWVDGVRQPILFDNPQGTIELIVPQGRHGIALQFRATPLRAWSERLSMVTLLLAVLTGLVKWRDERASCIASWLGIKRIQDWARKKWCALSTRLRIGWPRLVRLASAMRHALRSVLRNVHLPYILGVAALALLMGIPLLQFKLMRGYDDFAHIVRIVEFTQGLKAGQLLPRWAPDLGGGYGEPLFMFHPPFFYYLASLWHALGFGYIVAENLACLSAVFTAGIGMYLLAQASFGPRGGLVSAAAYLFSPFLLFELYERNAMPEFTALALLPLALWAIQRYARRGRYSFLLVASLLTMLIILTQNVVAVICVPLFALYLGCHAWALRDMRILTRGLICLAFAVGLSAFFWLPCLMSLDAIHIHREYQGIGSYRHAFIRSAVDILYSPTAYSNSPHFQTFIGLAPAGMMGVALASLRRLFRVSAWAAWLVGFAGIVLVGAAFLAGRESLVVWEHLPLLGWIEYPWRLLALVSFSSSLVFGAVFIIIAPDKRSLAHGVMLALIIAVVLGGLGHAAPIGFWGATDAFYAPENIAAKYMKATYFDEYEPIWVQERPVAPAGEPLTFLQGQGRILEADIAPGKRRFVVQISQGVRLRLNTFYFPGWTLYVDGDERAIDYANPQGVMEVALPPGQYEVDLILRSTPEQLWGGWLSLAAIATLCAIGTLKRKSQVESRLSSKQSSEVLTDVAKPVPWESH